MSTYDIGKLIRLLGICILYNIQCDFPNTLIPIFSFDNEFIQVLIFRLFLVLFIS